MYTIVLFNINILSKIANLVIHDYVNDILTWSLWIMKASLLSIIMVIPPYRFTYCWVPLFLYDLKHECLGFAKSPRNCSWSAYIYFHKIKFLIILLMMSNHVCCSMVICSLIICCFVL